MQERSLSESTKCAWVERHWESAGEDFPAGEAASSPHQRTEAALSFMATLLSFMHNRDYGLFFIFSRLTKFSAIIFKIILVIIIQNMWFGLQGGAGLPTKLWNYDFPNKDGQLTGRKTYMQTTRLYTSKEQFNFWGKSPMKKEELLPDECCNSFPSTTCDCLGGVLNKLPCHFWMTMALNILKLGCETNCWVHLFCIELFRAVPIDVECVLIKTVSQ